MNDLSNRKQNLFPPALQSEYLPQLSRHPLGIQRRRLPLLYQKTDHFRYPC